MKKIAIILVAVGILGGIFWFLSGDKGNEVATETGGSFPVSGEQGVGGGLGTGGLLPSDLTEEGDFTQLTQVAIAGAANVPNASTSVRYIEKATGHIYEINPNGKDRDRISNTTILKIFETHWNKDGDKVVSRYIDDEGVLPEIKSFSSVINAVSNSIEGVFLPSSVTEIAVSPQNDNVFYLNKPEVRGKTFGVVSDFENEKQDIIFSMPFGEFNVSWPSENIIALLTKPASGVKGFLYFLYPNTEKFEKVIGDVEGLGALVSPDGKKVIYSQNAKRNFSVKIFDVEEGSSNSFGVKTMPEKCVWSLSEENLVYCGVPKSLPRAEYPNDWYQGKISFNDSIWKIDIDSGETTLLLENANADAINLFFAGGEAESEKYLVFTNKKDNTLWSLKLIK